MSEQIGKCALLNAPIHRVWRAVSDAVEFGSWFGMKADGPFEAGRTLKASIVPTTVDAEVAAAQKAHEGVSFELAIERMEAPRLFSYRWVHAEAGEDASTAPTTLVEFTLAEQDGGVLLTITESGFDRIAQPRRAELMARNEGGWEGQVRLITRYLALHP